MAEVTTTTEASTEAVVIVAEVQAAANPLVVVGFINSSLEDPGLLVRYVANMETLRHAATTSLIRTTRHQTTFTMLLQQ